MADQRKFQWIIEAVDKATAVFNKIKNSVMLLNGPFNNIIAASKNLAIVGGALTVSSLGVAAALGRVGLHAVETADNIGDLAARYGASTEDVQVFGAALEEGGGTTEDAAKGIGRLNRVINEAIYKGGEARQVFEGVGIPLERLKKMSTVEVLEHMADAFSKSNEEQKKQDILNTALGKSGTVFNDTLNQGAAALRQRRKEMQEDGRILSTEQVQQADAFDKAWKRIQGTIKGLATSLGLELVPSMIRIVQNLQKWIVANKDILKTNFQKFAERLPDLLDKAWKVLELIWQVMGKIYDVGKSVYQVLGPTLTLLAAGAIVFAPTILAIVQLVGSLGQLFLWLGKVTKLFSLASYLVRGLWVVIAANPIAAIAIAIVGLAYLIYKNWDSIVAYSEKTFARIKAVFDISFFDGIIQIWLEAWQGLFNAIIAGLKAVLPENMMPDAVKNFQFSFATDRAMRLTDNASEMRRMQNYSALQQQQVGGRLDININSEGKATVTQVRKDNPAFDFNVNSGLIFAGS